MVKEMNDGKIFEKQFKKSVDKTGYFYHRLNDPPQSFNKSNLRFSLKNPYDCMAFTGDCLFCLELKTTKATSFSFWREDFEDKAKRQTFMIHKHQIQGLEKASRYENVLAGLVLNFREINHTYYWQINDFLKYTKELNKKSFNERDVISGGGILIRQEKKIKNYEYDIKQLYLDCKGKF